MFHKVKNNQYSHYSPNIFFNWLNQLLCSYERTLAGIQKDQPSEIKHAQHRISTLYKKFISAGMNQYCTQSCILNKICQLCKLFCSKKYSFNNKRRRRNEIVNLVNQCKKKYVHICTVFLTH